MALKSYYKEEDQLYTPLNVETVDIKRRSYWGSDKNSFVLIVLGIVYLLIMFGLFNAFTKSTTVPTATAIIILIVVTIVYILIPVQIVLRKVVFQEKVLRKIVKDLEANRVSNLDVINSVSSVGKVGDLNKGLISYDFSESGLKKGVIVTYDNGSIIDIAKGTYAEYRETLNEFYREMHLLGLDVMKISLKPKPVVSEQTKHEQQLVRNIGDEDVIRRTYHDIQLRARMVQEFEDTYSYQNYYLVTKRGLKVAYKLRELVEKMAMDTLGASGQIRNVRILDYKEVEDLVNVNYLLSGVKLSNVQRKSDKSNFGDLVRVVSILDSRGLEIPEEEFAEIVDRHETESLVEEELKNEENRIKEAEAKQQMFFDKLTEELLKNYNTGKLDVEVYKLGLEELTRRKEEGSLRDAKYATFIKEIRDRIREDKRQQELLVKQREESNVPEEEEQEVQIDISIEGTTPIEEEIYSSDTEDVIEIED